MQELEIELSIIKKQESKKRYPLKLEIHQRKLLQIYELFEKYQIENTVFPFQNVMTQIFYYFRRFTIVAALILIDEKFAQWTTYFLTCFIVLTRNLEFRPYRSKKLQFLHFFNEIILIIIVIILPAFEIDKDDDNRYIIGWVVNGLVLFDIAFQIVFIFIYLVRKLIKKCRDKKQKKQSLDTVHHFVLANQKSSITQNDIISSTSKQKKQSQDVYQTKYDPKKINTLQGTEEFFKDKTENQIQKTNRRKKKKKDYAREINKISKMDFDDLADIKVGSLQGQNPNLIASNFRKKKKKRVSSNDFTNSTRSFKLDQDFSIEKASQVKNKKFTDQEESSRENSKIEKIQSVIIQDQSNKQQKQATNNVDIDELDDISPYDFGYEANQKLQQFQKK